MTLMPIRPENKARYPANWKQVRERILKRALRMDIWRRGKELLRMGFNAEPRGRPQADGPARCGCWASEVAMGTMSEVETPTAVKQHRCCWCWQTIEAGEQYRRYRYWADGDAGTVKLHAECFEAMQDAAADEGGWIEWTPGSGERPNVRGELNATARKEE